MLTIFYRRFYLLLFLVWLGATAGVFVLSVWGDLGTFLRDFDKIMGAGTAPSAMNATNLDPVARTADALVLDAQVAGNAVRREVVRELRAVEQEAEQDVRKVFGIPDAKTGDAVERLVQDREAALQARRHEGEGELRSLTFTRAPDRLVAHLALSRNVEKVTVFWMSFPTRLVVDLRGDWGSVASRTHHFPDGFISRVAVGTQPDRLRLVFNFHDPKAPQGGRPGLVHTDKGLEIVVAAPAK